MSTIKFKAKLLNIGSSTIVHLPLEASAQLPSRGLVMVKGLSMVLPFTPLSSRHKWPIKREYMRSNRVNLIPPAGKKA